MKRAALALAAALLLPSAAQARSLAREGTVAILPSARFGSTPKGLDAPAAAPGLGLAFGFKPSASFELGIDVAGSMSEAKGSGGSWRILGAPLLLRASWTPTPDLDWRPVLHAGVGKALVTVDGPSYREHTPTAFFAALGVQGDLSDTIGLMADVGYLHSRADDATLGRLDAGGAIVRAGVYFRWEPIPERRF